MNIVVLGGTGYIGSAVTQRLIERGHRPIVAARSIPDSPEDGAEYRSVDIAQPSTLHELVDDSIHAVIYAAVPTGDWDRDRLAVENLLAQARTAGARFVYVSGIWVLGPTGDAIADEHSPTNPIELVAGRPTIEALVASAADQGVAATVLRPGIVHGRGGGIPSMLVSWARDSGRGRYVGEPGTRWPMVDVDDLADLVCSVALRPVVSDPGPELLHGIAEPAVPVRELARAADLAAGGIGGEPEGWSAVEAAAMLGKGFADALATDQQVRGDETMRLLGWRPRRPGGVDDLRQGSY